MPYKDFFYPANWISVSRIFLVYPFLTSFKEGSFKMALIYLIIMCITDMLDGFIARVLKQVSSIGKGIDPLADKICIIFVLHAILSYNDVSLIPFYLMLGRDAVLIYLGIVAINWRQPITGSDIYGKCTTFFLALAAIFFLCTVINHIPFLKTIGLVFYYLSFGFLVITFFTYGKISYMIISTHYKDKAFKTKK